MKVKRYCGTCGDESDSPVLCEDRVLCADCIREEEVKAEADNLLRNFSRSIDTEARGQLEFMMKKCTLCDQYYGPFSMERHLREDHAVGMSNRDMNTIRNEAYSEGYADGEEDRLRAEFSDVDY